MATTPVVISEVSDVPATETEVYENPFGSRSYMKLIVVTNYSVDNCTLSVWKVPSGDSYGNSNLLLPAIEVIAGDHVAFHYDDPGIILKNSGDKIYVKASAASKLNLHIYGYTS